MNEILFLKKKKKIEGELHKVEYKLHVNVFVMRVPLQEIDLFLSGTFISPISNVGD